MVGQLPCISKLLSNAQRWALHSDNLVILAISLLALTPLHSDVIAIIWSLISSLTVPMSLLATNKMEQKEYPGSGHWYRFSKLYFMRLRCSPTHKSHARQYHPFRQVLQEYNHFWLNALGRQGQHHILAVILFTEDIVKLIVMNRKGNAQLYIQ